MPSDGGEVGVSEIITCILNEIPRELTYKNKPFALRGVVDFTPPHTSSGVGHYRGYARRADLSWEIYDDLRDKVSVIDGSVKVNLHIILYTI